MSKNDTATQLLDSAQALIQIRGFNAFSYKDLAESVGIRTASIHYHFPAKADLGVALMQRYLEGLDGALTTIDRNARSARAKLKSFIQLYGDTESCGAICLCGSLASDRETLSPVLQELVCAYIEKSQRWVIAAIKAGVKSGEFELMDKPTDLATTLLSSLQGGLIMSRALGGSAVLSSIQRVFLRSLGGT